MYNLIKKIKTSKGAVCIFDADKKEDLENLPNSKTMPEIVQGSVANVIEEGKSYVLNSDDVWVPANRYIDYWEI